RRSAPPEAPAVQRGVNVVGYLESASGLGEIARLLMLSLDAGGIPHVGFSDSVPHRVGDVFDTTVVCVNPDNLPSFVRSRDFFSGRRAVGFWWWEVGQVPRRWRWAAQLFDEIWAGSDHTRDAIAKVVDRPVHKFPVPVVARPVAARSRSDLGLPSG